MASQERKEEMTEQEIQSALMQLRESTNNEIATLARIILALSENAAQEAQQTAKIVSQFGSPFSENTQAKD